MTRVALVTDSTASLSAGELQAYGISVVPLQVVIGGTSYDEGIDEEATPARLAQALRERVPVTTSRPTPAVMQQTYERLAAEGAEEIVAVHLSAEISATYESAILAAKHAPVPVVVVDSRQVGIATGFCTLAAGKVGLDGGGADDMAEAARLCAAGTRSLFYVDTLDYLRRGGRIGSAAAVLGTALAVKPLLRMQDGRIALVEKVRTSGKALARLADLAAGSVGGEQVQVAVAHLDCPDRAAQLAAMMVSRLGDALVDAHAASGVRIGEVGAVIGAHTGPGMVGVVVAPA